MHHKTASIYLITNLKNGKIYVGRTVSSLNNRWCKHVRDAYNLGNTRLGRAIVKYGRESFSIKTLETVPVDRMVESECSWILKLSATSKKVGYNLTLKSCGGGTKPLGLPTREKLSEVSRAYWDKIPTDERSLMLRLRMTGKPKSAKHKKASAQAKAGKKSNIKKSTSIFVGVRLKHYGKWEANCYHQGRAYGKTCETEVEAAEAYDMYSLALRGPEAPINFEHKRRAYLRKDLQKFVSTKRRNSSRYKHVSYNAQNSTWCVFMGKTYKGFRRTEQEAADLAANLLGLKTSDELLKPSRRKISRPALSDSL